MIRVLFLCTANSARSILAEAILNKAGAGRFVAASAGSRPGGTVNPHALEQLRRMDHATDGFHSKSWDTFAESGGAPFDIVITVCDNAAKETCPVWPGAPVTAHWGIPDPAAVSGDSSTVRAAFALAYARLQERITRMLSLDLESMPADERQRALRNIAEAGQAAL